MLRLKDEIEITIVSLNDSEKYFNYKLLFLIED